MTYAHRQRSRADDAGETEMEYDDPWPTRLPSSSYRYDKMPSNTGQHPFGPAPHPGAASSHSRQKFSRAHD